jgi:hypothetical protein
MQSIDEEELWLPDKVHVGLISKRVLNEGKRIYKNIK